MGCLVTTDGSDDNLIQPEDLKDCEVLPPAMSQPAVNTSVKTEIVFKAQFFGENIRIFFQV